MNGEEPGLTLVEGSSPSPSSAAQTEVTLSELPERADGSAGRVMIETYGCQMNEADTELMHGLLRRRGYTLTKEAKEADVILLNTCAVRERAEERIFGRLGWLKSIKRERPDLVLGVTGCMAERMREEIIARSPFVDLVVGPDAYRRLPDLVDERRQRGDDALSKKEKRDPLIDVRLDKEERYAQLEVDRVPGVSGWISIQRGCDKFCSFCIVPFVRGRERSLAPDEVVAQAREMAEEGFRELTLLGQTVSSYYERGVDFADLLKMVHEVEGIDRIRFTSPHPIDFSDRLLDTLATLPKVAQHLHLPVQSGSTRVLKDMRRGYSRERFLTLIKSVREKLPEHGISTDVIVGYPGETEADFEETMSLMEQAQFDSAFMFYYSERAGTLAARRRPDDVPLEVKKARLQRLIARQEEISRARAQGCIGRRFEVLVVGPNRRDPEQLIGRSSCFRSTIFDRHDINGVALEPGDLVEVEVDRATSHTLFARPVSTLKRRSVSRREIGEAR
ncbi:MAG: tRNA (N6-isopentenyl adenosine(37)-C2)-methylthiotransferase MiaB [Myxococcota bacterium]|nr:tRNA (N6-isopentenyl adenosine(37)-C2)-methylthiotransferase MiaB [Myxococcota bacterium]